MNKLYFLATVICTAVCISASAQQYDVIDQVSADWRKAAAMEGPHIFDNKTLTPSPKGYKPFYISHYGRHGSRYAWNDDTYIFMHEILGKAHKDGALTPEGEAFFEKYETFYQLPLINTGDLVPLGFEQHKKIGELTCKFFPEVFKGKGRKVNAVVSTSGRSIVSMSSFCLSLKGFNPQLDIYQSSTHAGMCIAAPSSAPKPLRRSFKGQFDTPSIENPADFKARNTDYKGIAAKFFTDPDYLNGEEKIRFINELFSLMGGYRNYCEEPIFDGIVSASQMANMWESNNYSSFYGDITARYANIPLLEDIVAKAEAAFGDPSIAANLRFGHDYVAEAFMCLINANGCGTIPEKPEDAKYWFQSYNIPMATTIMFVFYRNKQSDILFKLVWNEHEATLPQLTPVSGPYYKWSDFKQWCNTLLSEHPEL